MQGHSCSLWHGAYLCDGDIVDIKICWRLLVVNVGRGWSATVISVVGTVVLHAMTGSAAVAASPTANVTLTTCTNATVAHCCFVSFCYHRDDEYVDSC